MQAQTLSNWKLIIVNDGGDNVEDIVSGFADSRIEYHNRQHAGKAAQLNFALSLVESKYIGYLDDDDRVMPEHYELLYNAAETNKAEFVYSNVQPVVRNYCDDSVIEEWPVDDDDTAWSDIRLHNKINHSTILHTKSLAEKVGGYDERMQVLIDFDYIKRLASLVKPFHVHATTYQWNLREDASGQVQSISGLWKREPEEAGRSLQAFFEKDLASLAICYQEHGEIKVLKRQIKDMEIVQSNNARLTEQLTAMENQVSDLQEQMTNLRASCSAKSQRHLCIIRVLFGLNIVLVLSIVILVFFMFL